MIGGEQAEKMDGSSRRTGRVNHRTVGDAAPSRGWQVPALAIGPAGEEAVLDVLHQDLGAAFAPPDLLGGVDRKQKGLVAAAIRAEQLVPESDLPLVAALDDEILC